MGSSRTRSTCGKSPSDTPPDRCTATTSRRSPPGTPVAIDFGGIISTAHGAIAAARDRLWDAGPESASVFIWPEVSTTFNWAIDWFDAFAIGRQEPGLIIVGEEGAAEEYSFDWLATRSSAAAAWLFDHGVRVGDALVLMLDNQVELWLGMLAAMKAGAIIIPTTTASGPRDIEDRVTRGGASFALCNASEVGKFAQLGDTVNVLSAEALLEGALQTSQDGLAHPGTRPEEPLLLYFTSGTTSRPKLVEHTQVSYPVGHLTTMYWLGLRPGDRHLNLSSPGWAKHAWSSFFAPWLAEATVVAYRYRTFDPARLSEVLENCRVTTFCAPPTVWRMLINNNISGGPWSLRELVSAGEPLNPEVIDRVRDTWGLTIRDGYGQTETSALVANVSGAELRPGSMGRPLPGIDVVIVDPVSGEESPDGDGELCLRLDGPLGRPFSLMRGYQDDADRNAEAMAGGYYHTGDVVVRDEDGYITFVGRTDDVFKASDYRISPFELESVLIEHPAVAEAAVVPAPDPVRLAVPKAYVVLSNGFDPSEETARSIFAYGLENLAPYKRIRRIEFFDLPKTISGKIRRVELKAREEDSGVQRSEYRLEDFPELRTSR